MEKTKRGKTICIIAAKKKDLLKTPLFNPFLFFEIDEAKHKRGYKRTYIVHEVRNYIHGMMLSNKICAEIRDKRKQVSKLIILLGSRMRNFNENKMAQNQM